MAINTVSSITNYASSIYLEHSVNFRFILKKRNVLLFDYNNVYCTHHMPAQNHLVS